MIPTRSADYVVVGTGSAGAVVAARLSERSADSVIALEAGPADKNQYIHIPAAFAKLFGSDVDWTYLTTPQPALGGRQIFWPRGKTFGGSSSLNAMMWVRGFAADYDEWAEHAGPGWGFASVLDYFRRVEAVEGASRGSDDVGSDGPLVVSRQRNPRPLTADFLASAEAAGYRRERANLARPDGFTETMVNQRGGARWSTADAYLRPAMTRHNLEVVAEAHATRILFDGTRAVGVEYRHHDRVEVVAAHKEVVLCGGAINTPQLLMLSGVGPAAQLAEHGIDVVADSGDVGQGLSDHLTCALGYEVDGGSLRDAEKPAELARYLLRKQGMLTSNVAEAYGFVRSRPELDLPDLEIIFGPAAFFDEGLGVPPPVHAAVAGPILLRPESRGTIELASADPFAKPIIDPGYLSDPDGRDRAAMIEGLRIAHRIMHTGPFAAHLRGLLRPRTEQATLKATLVEALTWNSHTLYHPTGTCRMGGDDGSVVDPELRVRGVHGLRVADASIMPTIIRGHTHAPSVVIGERAVDLIHGAG